MKSKNYVYIDNNGQLLDGNDQSSQRAALDHGRVLGALYQSAYICVAEVVEYKLKIPQCKRCRLRFEGTGDQCLECQKEEILLSIAAQLPDDIQDPQTLLEELKENALTENHLDLTIKASDVAFYAVKAKADDLLLTTEYNSFLNRAAGFVDLTIDALLACTIAKYSMRTTPLNDQRTIHSLEREAVKRELDNSYPT